MLRSVLGRLAGWCVAVTLTGCAAPPILPTQAVPEVLPAGTGMLAIQVVAPRPTDPANPKWRSLAIRAQATGRVYELEDSAPASMSLSLFAAPIPAGVYSVERLGVVVGEAKMPLQLGLAVQLMGYLLSSDTTTPKLPTFTVEAGNATNLGVMVTPAPNSTKDGGETFVLVNAAALDSVVAAMDTGSATRFSAMRVRGWDTQPETKLTAALFDAERLRPAPIMAVDLAPDRLLLGSSLGRVVVHEKIGGWKPIWTGSFNAVSAVFRQADGRIVAGTDNGQIFVLEPGASSWSYRASIPGERIVAFVPTAGQPGLLVETQVHAVPVISPVPRTRLRFLREAWDVASSPPLLDLEGVKAPISRLRFLLDGNDVIAIFNRAGFSRTAERYRIDTRSLKITAKDHLDHFVMQIYRIQDNNLARLRVNGLSNYHDTSADNGNTWKTQSETDVFIESFNSDTDGLGMALDGLTKFALNQTRDGGKTWVRSGVGLPASFGSLMRLGVWEERVVFFSGTTVVSTRDKGETWTPEWWHPTPAP